VALVHRYDGSRFLARELIRHGAIGQVRLIRYRSGRNMYDDPRFDGTGRDERSWLVDSSVAGGGILPSSAIHTFSVISFLLDNPRFVSVSGSVRRSHHRGFKGIEDDVSLLLRLEAGIEVVFEESWATDLDYELIIHGERGHLRFDGPVFNEISLTGVCEGPVPKRFRPYFEASRLACRPQELDGLVPPYFAGLATDMIAACRGESRPDLPDLIHARNMRAIIAAALEASATRHATKIIWRSE
jgi:predicted dehydrogenase